MTYVKGAKLQGNAWAAHDADIVGNVIIGDESSVWYHAVIRADLQKIVIGCGTNVQDNAVIHTDSGHGVKLGNSVTVGHSAILHGCTVGHNSLIGMGSIVMNGAVIGEDCMIGAGSLVTENTVIPDGMLALGRPAKVVRPLTEEEKKGLQTSAIEYMLLKNVHRDLQ